tara:strand:- start:1028 stop:2653 length:1626 start_codon:yes stop_codon:yes gene_type:complete
MNRIDMNRQGLASLGRDEDKYMAHVASGEMIVPPVITPETRVRLLEEMQNAGLDPDRYTVGNNMSINPITGLPEFGFSLKKAWKSVKKVVKKIAPVAAVIPGPWQPFAVVYNKANAINNIAKGDGGLGDILTLGAGGSQKLFGDSGAIKNITSGGFKTAGGGITNAFKNIGSVAKLDKAGNIMKDAAGNVITEFNPFSYAQKLGKTYADDQKQGYGGIFSDTGGMGEQAFNTVTNTGNPMNAVFTPGMEGQMVQTAGQQPVLDKETWLRNNFDLATEKIVNGRSVIQHKDGNFYTPEQALQMYQQSTQSTSPASGGFKTPQFIKSIGDAVGLGGASGLRDIYGGDGGTPNFIKGIEDTIKGQTDPNSNSLFAGGGGGMGGLSSLALPAFLGKIAYDASKKRAGGISETPKVTMDQLGRYQLSKELGTGGTRGEFGLAPKPAVLNVAGGGPINRMYYALGGVAELDMRDGGESAGPGTGTSDDIPAMLSDGEFVMTAAATKGAGAFKVNKTKSGIELVSGGNPSRNRGVENMRELMNIFEAV